MKAIKTRTYAGLFGIIILFVIINIISAQIFRGKRIDFTEEKLYTITKASIDIIKNIKDPITLKYYFSSTDSVNFPSFKNYGERVVDLLKSYEKYSPLLKIEIYDPRPDTEDSEWAEKYGISAVQTPNGEMLFCGLVLLNEMGKEEVIHFFDSSREEFLEYDISKALASLSENKKPVIGLYSSLDLEGTSNNQYPPQEKQQEPWYFLEDLKQMYDVRILNELTNIDSEISLLVIIHPKDLSNDAEFAIDQFVLSGKSTLIILDSFCEGDTLLGGAGNPMMMMQMKRSSSLPLIFKNSGINFNENEIILDKDRAVKVQTGPGQIVDYFAWISLQNSDVNKESAITGKLESLLFPTSGYFSFDDTVKNSLNIQTLVSSSQTACKTETSILMFGGSPEKISAAYNKGDKKLPIAITIRGNLKTAFPEGIKSEKEDEVDKKEILKEINSSNVLLVSDADFISNRFSLNITNLFGNVLISPINDNINFLFNALENLSGSFNLTEIRSRGKFTRPFTKVQEIEAKAENKWKIEENALMEKLEEANSKIKKLMSQEDNTAEVGNQAVIEELKKFKNDKLETQKKLREVRKNLRQEKEKLGTQMFLFNTFLIPFLFLLYGLFYTIVYKNKK